MATPMFVLTQSGEDMPQEVEGKVDEDVMSLLRENSTSSDLNHA